jgi:serine/threonine-protein kinase
MTTSQENMLKTGTVLNDKWVILELIGKGGMGEVYRAHQLNLNRDVAIKIISKEWLVYLDEDPDETEKTLQRFRREVQASSQSRHTNVLQIFDYGSDFIKNGDGNSVIEYIVMEYVPGASLRQTMSEEGFYPDEIEARKWLTDYFFPVLDGVQAIHEQGIVHRDLKPENILLDGGIPKVSDFGLARSCYLKPVTQSVDIKGTPPYMSPEHFFNFKRTDQRSDIYSLGKILYEAISGRMSEDTIPLRSASLSKPDTQFFRALDKIIQDATAEEREDRTYSVNDLKNDLKKLIELPDSRVNSLEQISMKGERSRKSIFIIGIIAVIVTVTLLVAYYTLRRPTIHHHEMNQAGMSFSESSPYFSATAENNVSSSMAPDNHKDTLPQRINGANGAALFLIPDGTVTFGQNYQEMYGKIIKVKSFYMSETPVTNQQYVDFLNEILPQISVEDGHVLHNGTEWLRLGEVIRGYKPIVYREGRFHIKNAMHAACPVIRITGYGAEAYSEHYGVRLVTDVEWLYVLNKDTESKKAEEDIPAIETTPLQLPIPTPVMLYKPNSYGIRALDNNIGEWGTRFQGWGREQRNNEYVLLGGLKDSSGVNGSNTSVIQRPPKKSYADVGFRTVMSITSSQ